MEAHEDCPSSSGSPSPTVAHVQISMAPPAEAVHKRPTPRIADYSTSVTVRRALCAITIVAMSYYFVAKNWRDVFQYHPLLMSVGFVGFLPEIVHLSNNFRRCRSMAERTQTVDRHLQYAVAMKVVALLGFAAIEASKMQRKKRHFTSWHGLLGLLCVLTLVAQVLIGIVYHYRLGPSRRFPNVYAVLRKAHQWLGIALMGLGLISMWLGLQTHYATKTFVGAEYIRYFFGAATGLAVVYAYYKE